MNKYTINDITRASGGFAMLAVDQREAMRMMFAAAGAPAPVADSVLTDFKVNAAKALSILVDQQFCYRQVVEQNAIAKSCAMIVAADEFIPGNGIPVDSVVIDRKINPLQIKQDGGKALKLLVLWRSDEDAQQRLDMVKEFNELCHSHGLVSIIEPVVRPPRRGDKFDREQAIIDAAKELGDTLGYEIPVVVANDGDVSALAGAMGLGENGIMGIAMGTSEAVGYVDGDGNICGWLNELAFAPVDGQPGAMEDEWSGDIGCGVKYFSQDGVIKLAPRAGIELTGASPAEKLKEVQALMAADDARAKAVYESIGVYLGHTLALYAMFYDIHHVQMMGRVMSGRGGDIILDTASRVMDEEYPDVTFRPEAPDEKTRRVGQSAAAASLPEVK